MSEGGQNKSQAKPLSTPASPPVHIPKLAQCVIAVESGILQQKIEKDFNGSGIRPIFAASEQDLDSYQDHPETFVNFVDLRLYPQSINLFRGRDTTTQKSYWVALVSNVTNSQTQSLLNMGFSDVLNLPVHPVTFKSRSRLFLTRFLRNFDLPHDVELPPGMSRRIQAGGGPAGKYQDEGHTHRIHDLTPDQMQNAWNIHSSGPAAGLKAISGWVSRSSIPSKSPLNTGAFGNKKVDASRLAFHKAAYEILAKQPYLFVPIENNKDKYFNEAVHKSSKTLIWNVQGWQKHIQVKGWSFEHSTIKFTYPEQMSSNEFADAVAQAQKNEQLYVSIFLQRARIFFSQNLQDYTFSERDFSVKIPSFIYLVQRRENFRLPLLRNSKLSFKVSTSHGILQTVPDNISAAGALLTLPVSMAENLQNSRSILKLNFEIYGKKISCEARVVRKRPTSNNLFTSVAIHFMNIESEDQDGINLYVMEESYEYTRLLK